MDNTSIHPSRSAARLGSVRPRTEPPKRRVLRTSFPGTSILLTWISCFRPELKVTRWLGRGLQHRTWVLLLPPARVLCCSQRSSLSASLCLMDRAPTTDGSP